MNASPGAFLFWISVVVCSIAELAIVAATVRASRLASRRAPASNEAATPVDVPHVEGGRALPAPRRWLEILYALVPALGLALLLVFTWRAMHPTPDQPPTSGPNAEVGR